MGAYLQLKEISKHFAGVQALDKVSVDIDRGEIHVIIGENGAGKSTLMKIVAGLYQQDSGQILLDGKEVRFSRPLDAIASGVSMIHQELMPVPYLTVAEDIYLGREPLTKAGLLDKKEIVRKARELLEMIGIDIDPKTQMRKLSTAQTQLIEIAKAVSFQSKILIMDEPTSALSDKEIEQMYKLIFKLKAQGVAIVFISHKLEEIFRVADRVTVLRDGHFIATKPVGELTPDSLIAMMIGREITNIYEKVQVPIGEPIMEVKHLTKKGLFEDISFTLYQNEILGVAGLMGAGRTEMVSAIFGLAPADSGEIWIHGKKVNIKSPSAGQKNGLALIPESRHELGLDLKDTTGFNMSLCSLDDFKNGLVLSRKKEQEKVKQSIRELNVKVPSHKTPVNSLSGGNQQKVVIAKWLMTEPDILIMDEPTRGIDVGAKAEIYKLISQLAQQGKSVIMVSSELPEIVGMSDRVLVLCEGKLTGILSGEQINQQEIMRYATNEQNTVCEGGNKA